MPGGASIPWPAFAWAIGLVWLAGLPAVPVAALLVCLTTEILIHSLGAAGRSHRSDRLPFSASALASLMARRPSGQVLLGRGGPWLPHHTAALLAETAPVAGLREGPARQRSAPWVDCAAGLMARHVLAVGAPGSGKSSLLVLLAWQAQRRGEALLVLDPKGSRIFSAQLAAGARQAGVPFLALLPGQPGQSVTYDPLQHCADAAAVASRLCGLLGAGREDPFRTFCWGALATLTEALLVRGFPVSIGLLHHHLADAGSALLQQPATTEDDVDPARWSAAQAALILLAGHDRTHYRKMTAGLLPLFTLLDSGPVASVLQSAAAPARADMVADLQDAVLRPALDLAHLARQSITVYVGLDALANPVLARALAHLLLEDLAALAAVRMTQAGRVPNLHLVVDEAGEIACEPLLQLLGKGREANLQILLAVQTLADLEWRLESRAAARVAEGNAGAWFLFRQLDAETRRASEARLGSLPTARPTASSSSAKSVGPHGLQRANTQAASVTREYLPRVPEAVFASLADLECLAQLPDGQLLHLRLPRPEVR